MWWPVFTWVSETAFGTKSNVEFRWNFEYFLSINVNDLGCLGLTLRFCCLPIALIHQIHENRHNVLDYGLI